MNLKRIMLCGLALAIAIPLFTEFGKTAQIRLDTGDLRWCIWGMPVGFEDMPEPYRGRILAASQGSTVLRAKWRTCAIYPLPTSNNPDSMCRRFYREASAWCSVDPTIARFALEDIATYINNTKAQWSLPDSIWILGPDVVSWGTGQVTADWRTNHMVQMYCEQRGYKIPNQPVDGAEPRSSP
jgi:hypothetical protein